MQSFAQTSSAGTAYGASSIPNAINAHGGTRKMAWQIDALNGDKSYKSDLTPFVTSFEVAHDADQPIHRTLTLDMVETAASQMVTVQGGIVTSAGVAYSTDLVRPVCHIYMPDGGYVSYPLGIFKWKRPGAQDPGYAVVRHGALSDLSYIVSENEATSSATGIPLYLPAGAYVIDVIHAMLVNGLDGTNNVGNPSVNGVPGCDIPTTWIPATWPTSSTLTAVMAPGYTLAEGTSYLDEINKLLGYIKCYPLWVDETGMFQITPWPPNQDYTVIAPTYTYDSQVDCIIMPGVSEEIQLDGIKNVVQVIVEDASRVPIYAIALNHDTHSPYNCYPPAPPPPPPPALPGPGPYGIGPFVDVIHATGIPSATDQNWAQAYANQQLMFHMFLTDIVTMETAVNPAHQNLDVIALNIYQQDVKAGNAQNVPFVASEKLPGLTVSERFQEKAWTIKAALPQLTGAKVVAGAAGVTIDLGNRNQKQGSVMTHVLRRVTSVFHPFDSTGTSTIGMS